jgi:hypothetical protein
MCTAGSCTHGTAAVVTGTIGTWGAADWVSLLPTLGVQVLVNEHRIIRHSDARLLLAGATDYSAGKYLPGHASDPAMARQGAGTADYSILLAHQPRSFQAALDAGYDMQLSGHVHGGQFFMELLIRLVRPATVVPVDQRVAVRRAGTGYWGRPTGVPAVNDPPQQVDSLNPRTIKSCRTNVLHMSLPFQPALRRHSHDQQAQNIAIIARRSANHRRQLLSQSAHCDRAVVPERVMVSDRKERGIIIRRTPPSVTTASISWTRQCRPAVKSAHAHGRFIPAVETVDGPMRNTFPSRKGLRPDFLIVVISRPRAIAPTVSTRP